MKTPRYGLTITWLADGRMFAVGGGEIICEPARTVEMLHMPWDLDEPANSEWLTLEPLLEPRLAHGAAFIAGKLIVAGGDKDGSVECLTPPCTNYPKGQWTKVRPLQAKDCFVGMVPFGEGLLGVRKCKACLFLCRAFFSDHIHGLVIKACAYCNYV